MNLPNQTKCNIAVIGLGYVGLPLALEFAERKSCFKTNASLNRKIIGFDTNAKRIKELISGIDCTYEIDQEKLSNLKFIKYTNKLNDLIEADIFIVTVPTPINISNKPDLSSIEKASVTVGEVIKIRNKLNIKNNKEITSPIIIYESTVYPGCIEEVCVPIIEKQSNLVANKDFFYGYSPERINPGDSKYKLKDIKKITSGSNEETSIWVDNLYGSIIDAGTHICRKIKIAEAAKVIENTQRDLNIALVNELAIICNLLQIDTIEVLEAAETKWNFHSYRPGLVGGHCIGVDPYYLTFKSQKLGYVPEVVLAGRRINNSMGERIVDIFIKEFLARGKNYNHSNVLICGLTFKENCPDIRNTKVIDIINKLKKHNLKIDVVDPYANIEKSSFEYGIEIMNSVPNNKKYDGIIVTVSHNIFKNFEKNYWKSLMNEGCVLIDVKGFLPYELKAIRL